MKKLKKVLIFAYIWVLMACSVGLTGLSFTAQAASNVETYTSTGTNQDYIVPTDGWYKIEAWGAQGQDYPGRDGSGGKGGYASGTYYLTKGTVLTPTVGSKNEGSDANKFGIFKGGTGTKASGGSASSVRIGDEFLVVAGGGGAGSAKGDGGAGGTEISPSINSETSISDGDFGGGGGAVNGSAGMEGFDNTNLMGSIAGDPHWSNEEKQEFWNKCKDLHDSPYLNTTDIDSDNIKFEGIYKNSAARFIYAVKSRVDTSQASSYVEFTADGTHYKWNNDTSNPLNRNETGLNQYGVHNHLMICTAQSAYFCPPTLAKDDIDVTFDVTTPIITVAPHESITFSYIFTCNRAQAVNDGWTDADKVKSLYDIRGKNSELYIINNDGSKRLVTSNGDYSKDWDAQNIAYYHRENPTYVNNTNDYVKIQANTRYIVNFKYENMGSYMKSIYNAELGYAIDTSMPPSETFGGTSYISTEHEGKEVKYRSSKGGDRVGDGLIKISLSEVNTYYEHLAFDPNVPFTGTPYTTIRTDSKREPVVSSGDQYTIDNYTTKVERNDDGLEDTNVNGRQIVRYGKNIDYCSFDYGTGDLNFTTNKDGFNYYATGWYWHPNDTFGWKDASGSNSSGLYPSRQWFVNRGLPTDRIIFTDIEYPLTTDSDGATFNIYYVPKKVNMKAYGSNLENIATIYTNWEFHNVTYHRNADNGFQYSTPTVVDGNQPYGAIEAHYNAVKSGTDSIETNELCYTQFAAVYAKAKEGYRIHGYTMYGIPHSITPTREYTVEQFQMRQYGSDVNTLVFDVRPITYTVTFNANGGSGSMGKQTFTYDVAQNLTNNAFTKTGYTFNGWNTQANGSGTSYANGQSVKNLASTQDANITLYAQWKPNTYTVNIYPNKPSNASSNVNHTNSVSGWTWSSNHWTKTFTYDSTTIGSNPNSFYSLTGWTIGSNYYLNTGGTGTSYNSASKNLTTIANGTVNLYVTWTPNTYTVTFKQNKPSNMTSTISGRADNSTVTVKYDHTDNNSVSVCSATGWVFQGWFDSSSGGTKVYDASGNAVASNGYWSASKTWVKTSGVTVYAQWKPITYYIYYDKGLTNDTSTTTIASATRNTNIQSTGTNRPYTKAEYDNNVVVAKRDKLKGTSYSITFDGNLPSDVTQNMKDSYELTLNKSSNSAEASLQELTSSGFTRTIKGTLVSANTWKLEGTLKGTVTLTEGATLTKPNYYNKDGATGVAVAQWNSITLNNYPTPKMDGYVFMGWYDSKSYTLTSDGNGGFNYTPSGNKITTITVNPSKATYTKTLYAHWKPVMAYLNYSYSDGKAGNYTSYDNGNIVNDLNRGYPTKSVHIGSYYWEYKGTGVNASFFKDYPSKYVPYASIPSPALYFNIDLYPRTSVKDGSNVQGTSNNFSVLMPDKFLNTVYTFTTPNGTKTDLVNANNASETWSRVNATGVSYAKEQAENQKYSYRTYDVYDFTGWYLSNSSENTIGNSIIDSSTKIASKTQDRYDLAAKYQAKPSGMKLPLPKRILVFNLDDEGGTIQDLDSSDEMNNLRALARGESVTYADGESVGNIYKGRQIQADTTKSLVYDFTFKGWVNGSTTYQPLSNVTVSKNTNLLAKWATEKTLTLPQVEKAGYVFMGWFTVPQNIITTDAYTNPYGSDNDNIDKYYAGAGYRTVDGEWVAQDCNLRINECDLNWDISTNKITLYAWFNREPIFIDMYEGLFFEGQDVSIADLRKLVGVFDYEDDYSALALEFIESLPTVDTNVLYLPVISDDDSDVEDFDLEKDYDLTDILETIQIENYAFDTTRWEPVDSSEWETMADNEYWETVDSEGNTTYPELPNETEENSATKVSSSDHPIYIRDGKLYTPNHPEGIDGVYRYIGEDEAQKGNIYYTDTAKAELASYVNNPEYTKLQLKVKSITYKVKDNSETEEVWTVPTTVISDYDKEKAATDEVSAYTNSSFVGRKGINHKYIESQYRLDTSSSRLLHNSEDEREWYGDFDVTYEVTDNGLLLNGVILTGSPITISYTRGCRLRYNQLPIIYLMNLIDFTDTTYDSYETFKNSILDAQTVLDGEDTRANLPWWTRKKTAPNLLDTLEIVGVKNVEVDYTLCAKYNLDGDTVKATLNEDMTNQGISALEYLYSHYKNGGDTEKKMWQSISSFDIVVDAHDQWGKYASGKVLSNYPYGVDAIEGTPLLYQDEQYRTISIILVNAEDSLDKNNANIMKRVRFINNNYLDSVSSKNSYWGAGEGKDLLEDIMEKRNNATLSNKQTTHYTTPSGTEVTVTIEDYSN